MFFFFFFYSGKNEIGMLRFPSGRQPRKRGTRNRVLCGPISPLTSSPPSFSFIIFLLKVHFKSSENCFSLGDNSAHTHTNRERHFRLYRYGCVVDRSRDERLYGVQKKMGKRAEGESKKHFFLSQKGHVLDLVIL